MAKVRINGTTGPIQQPLEISYDPQSGQKLSARYECGGDNLVALANWHVANRIACQLTRSGAKSTLIAQASGGQYGIADLTADTWQLLANEIQKDLREHPDVITMEQSFPGTIGYVQRDVDLYNQGLAPGNPAPPDGAKPTSSYFFNLLIRGSTHYVLGQYVLRHTTNVSNTYAANVADLNVGRIYTTAQLLIETMNVSSWVYPLPGRLAYKINWIPAPAAQPGYTWGWLKKPSTETATAGNRVEITTEYWLEQWGTPLPYKTWP